MTIKEQLKVVVASLHDALRSVKGRSYPAGDVIHLLDELRIKPGAPSAGVMFWTEDPQSEIAELGKVARGFKAVVSRGKGFKVISGESLTEGAEGGPPMFDLVELVRSTILGLRMADEQGELQIPVYQGTGPFEVSGLILDAYEVKFALYAQIPQQDGIPVPDVMDGNDEL